MLFFIFCTACRGEEVTILHTNDTHSHLFSFGTWSKYGGISRMSHLIKELKSANTNVLTLHSGDVFVGTFAFNKYLGYAELKIMQDLYDCMCLGNHEFDLGIDALAGVLSGTLTGQPPIELPILNANNKFPSGHPIKDMVSPYMIKQVGSLKVGIFGVVTTDPYNYTEEVNNILTDPYQAAGQAVYALRNQGCDTVICLSHLGLMADRMGLSQVPGIDIIVGGHSHDALEEPQMINGKIIVQAGEFGKYLGELRVKVENGQVQVTGYRLHPVNIFVREDRTLKKDLRSLKQGIEKDPRFGPVYSYPFAMALWDIEEKWQKNNPQRDTPLGNLVTDAIRHGVEKSGYLPGDGNPLIALESNGYIAHKIYRGMVVGNDILRAVPYGYDPESGLGFKIQAVLLPGAYILGGLEFSVANVEYTDELSLQVSGLTFSYDSSKKPVSMEQLAQGIFGRVDPLSIRINGAPMGMESLYWVAINEQLLNFLSTLGLKPFAQIDTGLFEYHLVRDYVKKLKILMGKSEGRILDTAIN